MMSKKRTNYTRRWRAVRNATYDPKLADEVAYWSDERIFETLGIKVPQTVPDLKPMPRKGTKKRQRLESAAKRRIKKFELAILYGLEPRQAYKYRYRSFKEIERIPDKPDKDFDLPVKPPKDNKQKRKNEWANWFTKGNEPPAWVKRKVAEINADESAKLQNRNADFSEDSSYGWAILYYAYIDHYYGDVTLDEAINMARAEHVVDPFDADKYVDVLKT